jgi:hypothetical protein
MHESNGRLAARPVRDLVIKAAIILGGSLMVAGTVYGVVLQPGGPEDLGTLWPFYLGGVIAIALGWMNGDLQR